jgi:hypothetical protein
LYADYNVPSFSADGRLLAITGRGHMARNGGFEAAPFLTVFDTDTGEAVRTWPREVTPQFAPTGRRLAVLEPKGDSATRLGLWDFAADAPEKK